MILAQSPTFTVHKEHRFLKVCLQGAHRVISTSSQLGGEQLNIQNLLNCQCCEGSAEHGVAKTLHLLSREQMHQKSAAEAGLDPAHTVVLTTAANMDYAAIQSASYEDATVTAIATAGVEGNAGRAGDISQWHEGEQGYVPVHATPGTINIILIFHQSLSSSALTRSIITATEAKTAALLELAIPSRYGSGLATGTGTDQIAVATPQAQSERFHWTGHHAKLGELIGTAVRDAVKEALRWQNGLEASRTRHLSHALGRFGLTRKKLSTMIEQQVKPDQKAFLLDSLEMIENDPRVSAQAYAIAAILDRRQYDILPKRSADESLVWQAALLATSLSGNAEKFCVIQKELYQEFLEDSPQLKLDPKNGVAHLQIAELLVKAIELGWSEKWM